MRQFLASINVVFSSVANEVRAKWELSSRNEYIQFAFGKNGDQTCTYAITNLSHSIGLSFYKNGDQNETKKHPKVYVRNFRNFRNFQNLLLVLQ